MVAKSCQTSPTITNKTPRECAWQLHLKVLGQVKKNRVLDGLNLLPGKPRARDSTSNMLTRIDDIDSNSFFDLLTKAWTLALNEMLTIVLWDHKHQHPRIRLLQGWGYVLSVETRMTTGFLKRVLMETSGRERTWKINDEGPLESLRTREPLCTGQSWWWMGLQLLLGTLGTCSSALEVLALYHQKTLWVK